MIIGVWVRENKTMFSCVGLSFDYKSFIHIEKIIHLVGWIESLGISCWNYQQILMPMLSKKVTLDDGCA